MLAAISMNALGNNPLISFSCAAPLAIVNNELITFPVLSPLTAKCNALLWSGNKIAKPAMDMKIQSEALSGANALETSRAQGSTPDGRRVAGPELGTVGHGIDSVSVSSLASRVAQASAADQIQVSDRVSQLARLYARGEYRPDAASLSRSLVSRALIDGNGGGKL
jgi:hypothetical protein